MTVTSVAALGGWYAAFISCLAAGILLFSKPKPTSSDNRDRLHTAHIMIFFGWIPLGIALAFIHNVWSGPVNEGPSPSYDELAAAIEGGNPADLTRVRLQIIEKRERYEDQRAEGEAISELPDPR